MSDIEDSNTTRRTTVKLNGPDDYGAWLRHINNVLLIKDLTFIADGTDPLPNTSDTKERWTWEKGGRKAWGLIDSSLSDVIHGSLPAELSVYVPPSDRQAVFVNGVLTQAAGNPTAPSFQLLAHLRQSYAATTGNRKAELWRTIWRSELGEGVDPSAHLAAMRTAHRALMNSDTVLADSDFAYAILMSLPESFSTIVQTFYLAPVISSAAVMAAVNTEFRRRQTVESANALKVRALAAMSTTPSRNPTSSRRKFKDFPRDPNAYCEFHSCSGHSARNCQTKPPGWTPSPKSANAAVAEPNDSVNPKNDSGHANNAVVSSPKVLSNEKGLAFLATTSIPAQVLIAHSTSRDFVVDSGASHHVVHNRALLSDIKRIPHPVSIVVANGNVITATESGRLTLRLVQLDDVIHVPALGRNLLSVNRMTDSVDKQWIFGNGKAKLLQGGKSLISAHQENGLYVLNQSSAPSFPSALNASVPDSPLSRWHQRLGHLGVREVIRLGREGRLDDSLDWTVMEKDASKFECFSCISGKGTRLPAPPNRLRATRPLQTIHVDLFGPTRTASLGGCSYFLTCYHDYTRKIHLSFLKKESEATEKLIDYIALVENQLDCTVKTVRSDQGGEFESSSLKSYFRTRGIEHHETPTDSHAQNGRVERVHLTILNSVRTLLFDSGLPDNFWAEAAHYAAYTRNRVPGGPNKLVPEDVWRQQTVTLQHLRPFGSRVFFRDHVEKDKLHPRYREGRLLSYMEGTSNYRVWDLNNSKVQVSRDVVFEKVNLDHDSPKSTTNSLQLVKPGNVLERFDRTTGIFVDAPLDREEDNLEDEAPDNEPEDAVPAPAEPPVPRRNPPRAARPAPDAFRPEIVDEEPPQAEPPIRPQRLVFDGVELPTRQVRAPDPSRLNASESSPTTLTLPYMLQNSSCRLASTAAKKAARSSSSPSLSALSSRWTSVSSWYSSSSSLSLSSTPLFPSLFP